MSNENLRLLQVQHLVKEGYVPFGDVLRAIPWPNNAARPYENDAEHSFSLAFIGSALGGTIGLDCGKIALYSTVHDFPERYAGDTSVWDTEGIKSKAEREAAAIKKIEKEFKAFPTLVKAIHDYENLIDEEARFVYALDKLVAPLLIVQGGGKFWKDNEITFEMHLRKVEEVRPKIAKHPLVLSWYDEFLAEAEDKKNNLFASS